MARIDRSFYYIDETPFTQRWESDDSNNNNNKDEQSCILNPKHPMNLHQRPPSPSYRPHAWHIGVDFICVIDFKKDFTFAPYKTTSRSNRPETRTRDIFLIFFFRFFDCSLVAVNMQRKKKFVWFNFVSFFLLFSFRMFDLMYSSFVDIERKQCRNDNCYVDWFVSLLLN